MPTKEKVAELQVEVAKRYREATADLADLPTKSLPDFREDDGVRLQTYGMRLTDEDVSGSVEEVAQEIAEKVAEFERGLVTGAKSLGRVTRCFLEGHEEPAVFLRDPTDETAGVKVRHNFAVSAR